MLGGWGNRRDEIPWRIHVASLLKETCYTSKVLALVFIPTHLFRLLLGALLSLIRFLVYYESPAPLYNIPQTHTSLLRCSHRQTPPIESIRSRVISFMNNQDNDEKSCILAEFCGRRPLEIL